MEKLQNRRAISYKKTVKGKIKNKKKPEQSKKVTNSSSH